jgi:hypothetical protein
MLLMRDEFGDDISDDRLLESLTSVQVALIADNANLCSHAAQTAFVTAAILMARSGHQVHLMAPNIAMIGPQPPLALGAIMDRLVSAGGDLLPSMHFKVGKPNGEVDLAIALGNSPIPVRARQYTRLNATACHNYWTTCSRSTCWRRRHSKSVACTARKSSFPGSRSDFALGSHGFVPLQRSGMCSLSPRQR